MIAARSMPWFVCAYRAATAALLKRQNPIGRIGRRGRSVIAEAFAGGLPRRPQVPPRRCLLPSLPGDADAGRWRGLIRHEERRRERLGRVHAIFLEIGDALGREE